MKGNQFKLTAWKKGPDSPFLPLGFIASFPNPVINMPFLLRDYLIFFVTNILAPSMLRFSFFVFLSPSFFFFSLSFHPFPSLYQT